MFRRRKAAMATLIFVPLLAGGFMLQDRATRDGARLFDQVLTLVSDRYVDTLKAATLYEQAARGLVKELNDPFTQLLTPKELARFTTNTGGRYGGIGMQIEDQEGLITVSRVFPRTPAEEAGVLEGDRIIAVESRSTRGWGTAQVSDSLLGIPGTKVNVRFARPGVADPIDVRFTRAVIHIPAVPYALMLDGKVGYVPLQQFNETASRELEGAIKSLQKQGARAMVLDLRGNGGGILDQALSVSNLFLPAGEEIASVRGRGATPQLFVAEGRPVSPTLPLIVLIDDLSASASEIVAGALQDHDRALIVGTTSFGKGLVQTLFPLDGGYALKMTTAKWFTPSGRSIQKERTVVNGRFVDDDDGQEGTQRPAGDRPDSLETEAVKKDRPVFRSDAGRIVYGGGGITPDIIIPADTISSAEQAFVKSLTPKWRLLYVTLHNYAIELKPRVRPGFAVDPMWREEFHRRLVAAGIDVDRAQYDAAAPWVDRQIAHRVTRLAFGDSAAKRREIATDAPLRRALEVIERGQTQQDLFAVAQQLPAIPEGKRQTRVAAPR